jgi:DNA-binding IclR family transcriptional regulator
MLCTFERLSYLEKLHNDNRYVLGAKFVELGRIAQSRLSLLHVAIPYLEVLQEQFNENVNLALIQNGELLYLHTLESTQPVRVYERPNRRMAVYCSAIGKAILAYMRNTDIDSYLQTTRLVPLTATTITRVSEFRRELQSIRSRGFAIDNEENSEGVICVGVPVLDDQSRPVGGISLSGPSLRMEPKRITELGEELKNVAGKIAKKYSGYGK